ncbi:hypothetical protein ACFSRY_09820 [Pontibacter locisalis]|uniref:DUF5362 domain-containing protein n=1 Tax=Pontibacter locisalis TaxID=1719035 RepID=A0ABW5ILF7_9BACT
MESSFYDNSPNSQLILVNSDSVSFLSSAAKWGKFLAIVGFVVIGLTVLFAFFAGSFFSPMMNEMAGGAGLAGGVFFAMFYLLLALLYFFPVLYLYRFSAKMQDALRLQSENIIAESFKNLRSLLRFMGILTIVFFGLYALGLVFMMIGYSVGSMI